VTGAVVIVIVLLIFPVLIAIAGLAAAAILGGLLDHDARVRNEDSELLDLNT
jgi:hypothetical protein